VRGDPLQDLHREVAVGDADVHLEAADELLVDEQPVLVVHPLVAPGAGQLEVGGDAAGRAAHRGDAEARGGRDLLRPASEPHELVAERVERAHDRGVRLDRRALDLRGVGGGGQGREQLGRARRELPALEVEQVQLLLGAERQFGGHASR
jgi:hypothetical protein